MIVGIATHHVAIAWIVSVAILVYAVCWGRHPWGS